MKVIFWSSLTLLVYPYFIYPLFLWVISKLFAKRVLKGNITPKITLLISAYNEEDVIREKIENSLGLDYPKNKLEIVIASESTDGTNEIVKEYFKRGVCLFAHEDRKGKPATLYRTMPLVNGEIVVFSDANAIYKKDAIKKIVRNFNDKRIGCVSGMLQYVNSHELSIGKGEGIYWRYEIFLKKMLSRLLLLGGGANGSIFAMRKDLYRPINEFRGDDLELSARVEIDGWGVILEPEAISYEKVSETSGQEFRRKVRLASWNLKSTSFLFVEALMKGRFLTAWILLSHRLLRYISPLWLISIFISNTLLISSSFFRFLLFLQVAFYLLAFLGFLKDRRGISLRPHFLIPFYFCMVNCAASLAIIKTVLKKTEILWEKNR